MKAVSTSCFVLLTSLFFLPQIYGQEEILYRIAEEFPVGTTLGNVRTQSGLDGKYAASVLRTLRFSIMPRTGTHGDLFSITGDGGMFENRP